MNPKQILLIVFMILVCGFLGHQLLLCESKECSRIYRETLSGIDNSYVPNCNLNARFIQNSTDLLHYGNHFNCTGFVYFAFVDSEHIRIMNNRISADITFINCTNILVVDSIIKKPLTIKDRINYVYRGDDDL